MRRDTVLGDAVHLVRADLYLERGAVGADHRRVKRLVHVRLGHRDIVFEPARDRLVHLVDDAERGVTVADRIDDDPDGEQVVDLVKRLVLVDHLLIDGKIVLDPSGNLRFDPGVYDMLADLTDDLLDKFLPLLFLRADFLDQFLIDPRLPVTKREVVQFGLNSRYTEPLGDRSIDIHRLRRFFQLLLAAHILQRPHIVKAVGELDDDHADVLGHREEHLPQVFSLDLDLFDLIVDLAEFCHAVHEKRHVIAEFTADLFNRHRRILDDVMQDAGRDRLLVHLQVGQYDADAKRMDDIRFSGFPHLPVVGLIGDAVSLLDHRQIIGRMISEDSFFQFFIEIFRRSKISRRGQ